MLKWKGALILFVAALSLSIVFMLALTNWGLSGDKTLQIFGYDVYKFEGSGHYAIFYPMPDGSVKLLKSGKVGIFPTFVRVPRDAWLKEYATTENTLKATPTPIVIFVNDKGLGIASLRGSRVELKELEIPETREAVPASARSCPQEYVPEVYRYCIPKDPTSGWIKIIASKIVTDRISFLGLRVDNTVLKDVIFDMRLALNGATYSHWTAGIDLGSVTLFTTEFGDRFEGEGLKLQYITPREVNPRGTKWARYVNLDVKYVVVVYGVLAYDRSTGEYTEMPLVLTYPLEILTTGSYTIYETPDGGRKYVEFNPGSTFYVPSITEEPRYLTIPESANLNATWMGREDGRRLIVDKWLTNGRQFLRESSFSVPIGPGAAQALEREGVLAEYPRVLEVLNSMSLTLGFHSPSAQSSDLIYTLRGTPMEDFCVIWYHQGLNVFEGYKKVKVPMFLVTVTDGKSQGACNPVTGMNQEGG